MRNLHLAAALGAAALGLVASAPAIAQGNQCFFVNQWNGWKAPDDHTIYLNVTPNRIYRLDLAGACPEILWPDSHLTNVDPQGSGSICSPLDWQLSVSDGPASKMPCIVRKMTLLTPDEAAAIPKKFRP
jgi:hypothetical protein